MKLREIVLGNPEEEILSKINKEVIIHDEHRGWVHGRINRNIEPDVYRLDLADGKKQLTLFYHDLNTLLEVYPR